MRVGAALLSLSVSPLLELPGAVAGNGLDAPVAAHYGNFNVEQRALASGEGFVDLSHRDVVRISGPDRLTWLDSLTSQRFLGLEAGTPTSALILSPQGHVEHFFSGVDDGEAFTAWTEPGAGAALVAYLERMKFWTEVTVELLDLATVWRPTTGAAFIPRDQLTAFEQAAGPAAGLWAYEALRIERGEPRFGVDTDHKTLPNEVGWLNEFGPVGAVHLSKGCYRGQETVAHVHNLGKPPRRLVMLHFDGSENRLPKVGEVVTLDEQEIGVMGSSARHFELGPIGLALIKRSVSTEAHISVGTLVASQQTVVDPEIGLHFKPSPELRRSLL